MFERFTADARRTVMLGVELAKELGHDFVGTEHLLIGLTDTGPNVATQSLIASGFDPYVGGVISSGASARARES